MKTTITLNTFCEAFINAGLKEQFSYEGLSALFNYLETGEQIELDAIALCCEYSEAELSEVLADYSLETLEQLENKTQVIKVSDKTIIYQAF